MPDTDIKRKRMMVVRFSALGDVAMTLPVVYSLAAQYPELEIYYVTRPFFGKLFINRPENITIIPIDLQAFNGIKGTTRLLKKLSSLQPDFIADLHNVMRSWIIDSFFRLKGIKVAMVDKMRHKRSHLFKTGKSQPSFIDRYCDTFAKLGFPVKLSFKTLNDKGNLQPPVEIKHPAVGIAPNARYFTKTYPAQQVRELIGILSAKGYYIYLFGGRGDEAAALEAMASEFENCTSLAGLYDITQELSLMGSLDVMISMDSANQHLASLMATPVITVWGATTPACGFMPYGQPVSRSVIHPTRCQPCSVAGGPLCPKGGFACMVNLTPETIAAKVDELLRADSSES